jgi:phytoene dehydrogenase-like protein
VGVRLADGSEYRAQIVISAADGHATLFEMLNEKYLTEEIRAYYKELPIFQPLIQVSLGVNRNLETEPVSMSWALKEPIIIGGEKRERFGYKHYGNDPTMAPNGKSALVVSFPSNYEYWKKLDKTQYQTEKQKIAEQVIECLNRRFPGIKEQVEVIDVATPLTFERYTGNWQGSMEGWMITTKTGKLLLNGMRKTLPKLSNFYMIGQWVQPGGGLPPAAKSGRDIIKEICKQNGRKFITTEA